MRTATLRAASITIALALAATGTVVLAVEAIGAARDHAATAKKVLLDYAGLGAERTATRLQGLLVPVCNGILWAVFRPSNDARGRQAVENAVPPDFRTQFRDVTVMAHLGPGARVTSVGDESLPADKAAAIAQAVARATGAVPEQLYFGATWIGADSGPPALLVFQPRRDSTAVSAAYAIPPGALARLLAPALARQTLLPTSLTHGRDLTAGIGLRLVGVHGTVIADSGFHPDSPFQVRQSVATGFENFELDVSLDAALAPQLIIGGLPPNRVPLLLALATLTTLLMIAAGFQLRRERRLARVQESFVASVSHELRTPLTQIRLFAETLRLDRVRSPDERSDYLEIIEKESRRLTHLVDNLLHFSRVDRRTLTIAPELVDTAALVRTIAAEFGPLARNRGATIAVDVARDASAEIDEAAFRQVMLNLLDNAVRYGPEGQVITVRLRTHAQSVCLEVEDQGEGVPEAVRPHVWKRFWRGELARRPSVTGTGLGLAIVKDLVELHGGTASVADAPGGGALFAVTFPRHRGA